MSLSKKNEFPLFRILIYTQPQQHLPSISTKSLSYPAGSNRRSSFSSSTIFSSLLSSDDALASLPLGGADLLAPLPLSSLFVPFPPKRDSTFLPAAAAAPDGGFPPRLGGGLGAVVSDFLLTGRGRTGGGGLNR